MQFGIRLPTFAIGPDTDGADVIIPYVQRAEKLGFGSFFLIDHTLPSPPAYICSWLEPISVLGLLAGATKSALIGPLVLVTPFRHPLMLAKTFATLDLLSKGRVVYGVGVGWTPIEFENLAVPSEARGARADESLELVLKFWTEDKVDYTGKFFKIRGVSLQPKPVRKPHPPIWVGGGSLSLAVMLGKPAANIAGVLKRVARFADVWVPQAVTLPEVVKQDWKMVKEYLVQFGRNPDDLKVAYSNFTYVLKPGQDADVAKPFFRRYSGLSFDDQKGHYLLGTPSEIVSKVRARAEITNGVEHCIFGLLTYDHEQIDLLANEVIPELQRK